MKINKHGKCYSKPKEKEKFESFKCENCGCEFSVKEDEYYRDPGSYYASNWYSSGDVNKCKIDNKISSNYTISLDSPKDTLVCSCPECHKICKKFVKGEWQTISTPVMYENYLNVKNVDSTTANTEKDGSITINSDPNSTFTGAGLRSKMNVLDDWLTNDLPTK